MLAFPNAGEATFDLSALEGLFSEESFEGGDESFDKELMELFSGLGAGEGGANPFADLFKDTGEDFNDFDFLNASSDKKTESAAQNAQASAANNEDTLSDDELFRTGAGSYELITDRMRACADALLIVLKNNYQALARIITTPSFTVVFAQVQGQDATIPYPLAVAEQLSTLYAQPLARDTLLLPSFSELRSQLLAAREAIEALIRDLESYKPEEESVRMTLTEKAQLDTYGSKIGAFLSRYGSFCIKGVHEITTNKEMLDLLESQKKAYLEKVSAAAGRVAGGYRDAASSGFDWDDLFGGSSSKSRGGVDLDSLFSSSGGAFGGSSGGGSSFWDSLETSSSGGYGYSSSGSSSGSKSAQSIFNTPESKSSSLTPSAASSASAGGGVVSSSGIIAESAPAAQPVYYAFNPDSTSEGGRDISDELDLESLKRELKTGKSTQLDDRDDGDQTESGEDELSRKRSTALQGVSTKKPLTDRDAILSDWTQTDPIELLLSERFAPECAVLGKLILEQESSAKILAHVDMLVSLARFSPHPEIFEDYQEENSLSESSEETAEEVSSAETPERTEAAARFKLLSENQKTLCQEIFLPLYKQKETHKEVFARLQEAIERFDEKLFVQLTTRYKKMAESPFSLSVDEIDGIVLGIVSWAKEPHSTEGYEEKSREIKELCLKGQAVFRTASELFKKIIEEASQSIQSRVEKMQSDESLGQEALPRLFDLFGTAIAESYRLRTAEERALLPELPVAESDLAGWLEENEAKVARALSFIPSSTTLAQAESKP